MLGKVIFNMLLTLALLLMGAVLPIQRAAASEMSQVTISVPCPTNNQMLPHPGSIVDLAATFLFVEVSPNLQNMAQANKAETRIVYLHNLQVVQIEPDQSITGASCASLVTFTVDANTARLLTWIVVSRIPLRLVYTQEF